MESLDPKVYEILENPSPTISYYFLIAPRKLTTTEEDVK
tara:strand:+ start:763 stop:879 length:117 start_codon:yes stop_codon:yes gene_type:complete